MCPDAEIGETGVVNGITYTKRTRDQITPQNANTTCTSGITDMDWLFANNTSFNEDISSWDVSSVTNMSNMFLNAESFNQPLNNWDVSNVANMSDMLFFATNFNQDLSEWVFHPDVDFHEGLLGGTSFSIVNYDLLLESFSNQNLQNKYFGAHDLAYCNIIAREDLISNKGWTFYGDVAILSPTILTYDIEIVADEGTCEATNVELGTPETQSCLGYSVSNDAPEVFPLGETHVIWTLTDDTGESVSSTQIVTVTTPNGETTFPTIIIAPQSITIVADEGTCEATNVDLGTPDTQSCLNYSVSNDAPQVFPLGETHVIWTITDDAGESHSSIQIITVTTPTGETTYPTLITAPPNINIPADPGSCEATIDLGTPVTQSCWNYTVSNNAPDAFPLGQTEVIWTITDDAGVTDTSLQTVTVTMQVDIASICYVTSDDDDYTKNRVYINNIDGLNVENYEVLRETSTNVFTPMGTIAPGESSFLDETSNNSTQTYRYSLITTDICQNTSQQSPVHTTMLLQSNVAANNSINLNWSLYQGVNFGNFEIYRKINNGSFEQIATLPASNNMYNDTQANVQENSYEYYVAIQAQPCNTKLSGVQIRSNRETVSSPVGIDSNLLHDQVVLYPNPSSAMVNVQTPDWLVIEEIKLFNMTGHFITSHKQKNAINIENLSPGLYFIQIITEHGIITRKFTRN